MGSQEIMQMDHSYLMGTFSRYPIALVKARGARAWDAEGKEYLDFLGGIAVHLLGHCHPKVVDAITDQASQLIHCSNLYYNEPAAKLAAFLVQQGGLDKVFFCNSGAEANEGAFKLARKYWYRKGHPEKTKIISAAHAFHGRTLAAITATPKPEYQEGFGPLPGGFEYVPFNDVEALKAAIDDKTAAVILEPVQGEGGVHAHSQEYLETARQLCNEKGALLIFDEIQCGLGRTGYFYAYQGCGVKPDIITLAKGLGGGMPIGAILATNEAASGFKPGDHGTTFGGNPLACAAALATLRTVVNAGLVHQAGEMGKYLLEEAQKLQQKYPTLIKECRGVGMMIGIELTQPAAPVLAKCHEFGLLANVTAGTVLRLLPPYIINQRDADEAIGIIDQALASVMAAV